MRMRICHSYRIPHVIIWPLPYTSLCSLCIVCCHRLEVKFKVTCLWSSRSNGKGTSMYLHKGLLFRKLHLLGFLPICQEQPLSLLPILLQFFGLWLCHFCNLREVWKQVVAWCRLHYSIQYAVIKQKKMTSVKNVVGSGVCVFWGAVFCLYKWMTTLRDMTSLLSRRNVFSSPWGRLICPSLLNSTAGNLTAIRHETH